MLAALLLLTTLRIEAPLDELFLKAKTHPDAQVQGTLTDTTHDDQAKPVPVTVSLRGHTSRRESECTFPKLKVDLPDGTALKIGTHCGEATDDAPAGKYGRVPNQRSPVREAAVYRLLDAVGVPTLKARPARISYVYADHTLVRSAMLIEDDDEAVARLGGSGAIEASAFTTADRLFSRPDAATLAFAQAMIGNFDWCVKFSDDDTYRCDAKMKIWNVIAADVGGGRAIPIMYDFDLSGMVTGSHLWFASVFNDGFMAPASARAIEVVAQLQRTRSLFPRADLDAARARFVAKKQAAYGVLAESGLDEAGGRYMRDYLDAFYREVESDDRFYRPVVTVRGTLPRARPASAAVCASRGAIPVGTPVDGPVETRGAWVKVVLLDALWHWAPPRACEAILKGAVWIPARAVGRAFP